MSMFRILALICCLAALAAILVCALTNWNDELFLPLALGLSAAGNIFLNGKMKQTGDGYRLIR